MKRVFLLTLCLALCLCAIAAAETPDTLDLLLEAIELAAEEEPKALSVSPATFELSEDRQHIFIDRPAIEGAENIRIAYNIYDSDSSPVNYFYSDEERVAATPGYKGLFNVFIVVEDLDTGESDTQNIGWQEMDGPERPQPEPTVTPNPDGSLTVAPLDFEMSENGKSFYINRPTVYGGSGQLTIAYNLYNDRGEPVNYFYSNYERVAVTAGSYRGQYIVFVVVTDQVTGESGTVDTGWQEVDGYERIDEWPVVINGIHYDMVNYQIVVTGCDEGLTHLDFVDQLGGMPVYAIADMAFAAKWNEASGGYESSLTGPVVFPDSLTEIGNRAFENCSGITGLTIPAKVYNIKDRAFANCTGLKGGLVLNCNRIGAETFLNCSGLDGTLTLSDYMEFIGDSAFEGCSGLKGHLYLPNKLRQLGKAAFAGCSGLQWLTMSDNLDTIPDEAFFGCSGFTGELKFKYRNRNIGAFAFYGCSGFSGELKLEVNIKKLGDHAFDGCGGFSSVSVFPGTAFGHGVFNNTPYTFSQQWNGGWVTTVNGLFYHFNGSYVSLDGVQSTTHKLIISSDINNLPLRAVSAYAFMDRTDLTGLLRLPNSVMLIDAAAFMNCSGLKDEMRLPSSLLYIQPYAYAGCTGLTGSLSLPSGMKSIGAYAFYGCTGLSGSVRVPAGCECDPEAFTGTSLTVRQ
ncbi:MAG: leucine-rich repeat domain-containing protein [Clostridia bacterium]|nr:leucine-rich repeat domain-containing protein [Clostridia bacterium]